MRVPALALTILVALAGACGSVDDEESSDRVDSGGKLALDTGPAPWLAPTADVSARVEAAGLPLLTEEADEVHFHAHLDIFLDGNPVTVPGDIGIDLEGKRISPLHTHREDGLVHVEAEEESTFTLGQLFTQWGVRLTRDCIGGYCAPVKPFKVYVNGDERTGVDPATIAFEPNQQVAIVIGTPPAQIPKEFPKD